MRYNFYICNRKFTAKNKGGRTLSKDNPSPNDTPAIAKKRNRKEYMTQYYTENKAEISTRRKAIRLARREELNATAKEQYATDPTIREQRQKKNASSWRSYKERIDTDPEAKKRHEEKLVKRRERHKERLATDPEYRQRCENYKAAQHEKRRKQKAEGNEPQ